MEVMGHHADSVVDDVRLTTADHIKNWFRYEAPWFMASLTGHVIVLLAFLLILGRMAGPKKAQEEAPEFDAVQEEPIAKTEPLEHFEVADTPLDPTALDTETLSMNEAPHEAQVEEYNDDSTEFEHKGGGVANGNASSLGGAGNFDVKALGTGPAFKGYGGYGSGVGTGTQGGSGGDGTGFGGRGKGKQAALAASGGTRASERAVAAALYWFSRHQSADGSWSLKDFDKNTKCDGTCGGHGDATSDTAATAFGLLPFLAAGQTHLTKGPYQNNIHKALYYLMSVQKADGDMKGGSKGNAHMYAHGVCAIALCEMYGLSGDKSVGRAAQKSIDFIVSAQNAGTGGWRYEPGQEGDTSVVGWQVMALKSAQMAYLNVPKSALDGAQKWLDSCSHGHYKEQFSYQPDRGPETPVTAIGLLCSEYLHLKRDDPKLTNGIDYLMQHLPTVTDHNIYYWYYATQVVHNLPGKQWDDWNRVMRKLLIDTQEKEGCATGSWSPDKPAKDRWGAQGGRIMVTSLSCLTLEVYYRYLPLYKIDNEKDVNKMQGLGLGEK